MKICINIKIISNFRKKVELNVQSQKITFLSYTTLFLFQWQSITITLVEKVQMVAVILGSLFLVASVTWLLWSAFSPYAVWQRKDILFQICYGMYGFMDLVCIGKLKIFKQHRLWFKTVTISIFLIGHSSGSLQFFAD